MESQFRGIKFTDADVVNPDDFILFGDYNPRNMCPWLIHDHGVAVCVVFAQNEQDALDEACDCDKLDAWMIDPSDESVREDYMTMDVEEMASGYDPNYPEYIHNDGTKWWWTAGTEPTYLGNASEPFDIEGLTVVAMPNPPFSFCALFNAAKEVGK